MLLSQSASLDSGMTRSRPIRKKLVTPPKPTSTKTKCAFAKASSFLCIVLNGSQSSKNPPIPPPTKFLSVIAICSIIKPIAVRLLLLFVYCLSLSSKMKLFVKEVWWQEVQYNQEVQFNCTFPQKILQTTTSISKINHNCIFHTRVGHRCCNGDPTPSLICAPISGLLVTPLDDRAPALCIARTSPSTQ